VSGKRRSIITLGFAGVISGVLTIHPPFPGDFLRDMGIYLGAVFGIILAISLWVFHYYPRSVARAIAVVVSSTVAYIVAFFSTFFADMWVPHPLSPSANDTNPPAYVMFVGGTLGALIISTTVLLLYRDENTNVGRGILHCSFGGGILGVLGYSLGVLLIGQEHKPGDLPGLVSLYIIWQAGMGCLLAAYLPNPVWRVQTPPLREAISQPGTDHATREKRAPNVPLWGKLFMALVLVSLVSYIARVTWVTHNFRSQQKDFSEYQHQRPSLENLAPVVPMTNEQAVILHPIRGRTAQLMGPINNKSTSDKAASVLFTACYMQPDYRCEANPADVKVQVSQWPDSGWSTYEMQGIQHRYVGYSTHPKRIQKFGNAVLAEVNPKDPAIGKFYWTSGAVLVVVDSDVSDSDEFIREYLERYPSSL